MTVLDDHAAFPPFQGYAPMYLLQRIVMHFGTVAKRIPGACPKTRRQREQIAVSEQVDERRACTAHLMGLVLRQLRTNAHLTQRQAAELARYDRGWLGRAERGQYLLPEHQAAALDEAFDARGLLVELRRTADRAHSSHLSARLAGAGEGGQVMLVFQAQGRSVQVTLSRRDLARMLAAGVLSSAMPGLDNADQAQRVAEAIDTPARVDTEVIGYFRRVLTEHYSADKMLGPRSLLKPVLAQIGVLEDLRRGAAPAHVEPLLQVLSHYAEMAGWLHQDLGRLADAERWTRRAAEWARVAGDDNMAAYALIRLANIAALAEDHARVVQLAAAARRHPGPLEPKLAALAAQQQARGLVMLGEADECFALLDGAAETLTGHPRVSRPDVPVYLHRYDFAAFREQSAACYRAVGQIDAAATILQEQIVATPGNLMRDRGHLTAKLAVVIAGADPTRAASLGMKTITIARQTGSARIERELRILDSELGRRWPGHTGAATFHDALLAV
ncbi:XRE family transcriptional regulator [Spongiactinospora rosea]|uniref:XRE family transcriptional regulator n=1 Tax=Spongiactinospora rosea TaxID=2248750 RepID=A0A366LV40_9ACTN|nr:helix-turn-helix transcriptional regulator [Spongiactinospora rosea]RBQ17219.1 XRE family transcriptional regulator [Spongiactinospora rosea]